MFTSVSTALGRLGLEEWRLELEEWQLGLKEWRLGLVKGGPGGPPLGGPGPDRSTTASQIFVLL